MPVQIGDRTHSFAEPTGLLSDCHRRIEMFLGTLVRVAEFGEGLLDSEARASLEAALKYFREAAPKHTADEEESLFPRLRKLSNPELDGAIAKLDTLEDDHRWAEPLHRAVDELGLIYLNRGMLADGESAQFRDAVTRLQQMYCTHIEVE